MKTKRPVWIGATLATAIASMLFVPSVATASGGGSGGGGPEVTVIASGLEGASGGTIGPDGALYAGEGLSGEITRVDLRTGATTTYASGLPERVGGIGGVTDVAFVGRTAYALVTLVDPAAGGTAISGIYRIDDADTATVVADVGTWSVDHPPTTEFAVASGLQYAFEAVPGGFLVTDGHHNRVLFVGLTGRVIVEVEQFGNTVPTGLDLVGLRLYVAHAGATPHAPEDGRVDSLSLWRPSPREVASGSPLLVDVESGRCGLYALSQGTWDEVMEGSPALPDTGALVRAERDGSFSVVVDGLDRPTSLEFTRDAAIVIGLSGEVVRIDDVFPAGKRGGCR